MQWLIDRTAGGTRFPPSPIGFYFAKLWYFEQLYPVVYTVAALARASRLLSAVDQSRPTKAGANA